ncbi:MAG: fibronectin type III domain-containing protein [Candidatus Yonathbacteria bacterium]|nr:fibronectin type III domain-containing protein [Candidatus Yonathbacteria bacterium]
MNNNIIFTTIRVSMIAGIALFAFVDSAFAAPALAPAAVSSITETSATLTGYVSNQWKNSVVWFEWSEANSSSAPSTVALQSVYNEGTFRYTLKGLTPSTVYSYRAVAMEGGATVYSTTASFKTQSLIGSATAVTTYQSNQTAPLGLGPIANPQTYSTQTATQFPTTNKNTNTNYVVETKNVVVPAETKDGFTNTNTAAVIGAGNGMLPTTLIGWLLLIISVLVAVLIADMIYKSAEKRKKAREEKEREEAEAETE